jgi:hypothetical protein
MSGLAIGALIGAGVGGASAALQRKDILQGALMGGVTGAVTGGVGGAMGGASSGVASGAVEGALTGGEAATFMGSGALPTSMAPAIEYGIPSLIDGASSVPLNQSAQIYANTPMSENIASGFNSMTADPMKYLSDNKMSIGLAGLAGSMAPAANQNTNQDETTIYPYTYSASLNPKYTGSGTPYFNQNYQKLPTYNVANGGILSLAEGGDVVPTNPTTPSTVATPVKKQPTLADYLAATRTATANARNIEVPPMQANNVVVPNMQSLYVSPNQQYQAPIQQVPQAVTDYNNTLMQRAQNEYVNNPQLNAFSARPNDPAPVVTAPIAPVGTEPISYKFNPITRGYTSIYAPVETPDMGIAALQQPVDYGGDAGGAANGGLMGYAMGGDIGANYDGSSRFNHGPEYPMQQPQNFNSGGNIYNLGGYSDGGRLLRGPGDGVSDDIPAQIGDRQPARLADGEFVVPARIVSELGNGSTDAGAKRLYAMMDRVQANRKKTMGKGKVAVNSKSDKYLPA